jgi:hypothetical protein
LTSPYRSLGKINKDKSPAITGYIGNVPDQTGSPNPVFAGHNDIIILLDQPYDPIGFLVPAYEEHSFYFLSE